MVLRNSLKYWIKGHKYATCSQVVGRKRRGERGEGGGREGRKEQLWEKENLGKWDMEVLSLLATSLLGCSYFQIIEKKNKVYGKGNPFLALWPCL